jgi:hypothetical protein
MVDSVRLAATARRLIDKNGRAAEFLEYQGSDSSEPWNPGGGGNIVKSTTPLKAVFVSPSTMLGLKAIDEELLKRFEQFVIAAPEDGAAYNLTDYHAVRDSGGETYSIGWVEKLRPAELTLLYYFGVKR